MSIELNNLYIDDSVIFMKNNIEDNFIDLTITSPPYDNLRKYNGFKFDYKTMLNELYRVTKVGGVVVWVVADKTDKGSETLTSFKHALYAREVGFNLHDTMIYAKENYVPLTHNRYEQQFEYMFIFSKGKPNTFNPVMVECKQAGRIKDNNGKNGTGDSKNEESSHYKRIKDREWVTKNTKIKSNIWYYKCGKGLTSIDDIAFKHPAQFPELLALDHILSWSNNGDIVFDPMCGSGTVPKMAFLNNRSFIGIDSSEEYINDIAKPRLKLYGWGDLK